MKKDTHPQYFPKSKVTCSCGHSFTIGSTKEKISVEICSNCHPYFTGNEKVVDTAGRVEKFKARQEASKTKKTTVKKTKKSDPKLEKSDGVNPKSDKSDRAREKTGDN